MLLLIIYNSHKEVEELTVKKKGWQKSYTGVASSSLLNDSCSNTVFSSANDEIKTTLSSTNTTPKSMMEFGRDWRRITVSDEKMTYLHSVCTARYKKIVVLADDFELLENVIDTIVQHHKSRRAENNKPLVNTSKWLILFKEIKQFNMLSDCLSKELLEDIEVIMSEPKVKSTKQKEKKQELQTSEVPMEGEKSVTDNSLNMNDISDSVHTIHDNASIKADSEPHRTAKPVEYDTLSELD